MTFCETNTRVENEVMVERYFLDLTEARFLKLPTKFREAGRSARASREKWCPRQQKAEKSNQR